jgi:hypothetical protein
MNTSSANCIQLSPSEMMQAAIVGVMRNVGAIKQGRQPIAGQKPEHLWSNHIEGALAEMAAAKVLGVYWSGTVNTFAADDLEDYEVRQTAKDDGPLIVRPHDDNTSIYILVTGVNGMYRVVGWLSGEDAKKEHFKASPGGRPAAYFVPQSELNNIEEIHEHRTHRATSWP